MSRFTQLFGCLRVIQYPTYVLVELGCRVEDKTCDVMLHQIFVALVSPYNYWYSIYLSLQYGIRHPLGDTGVY